MRWLALDALITPEEQRQFGKVYIGGFLEATLKGKKEYLPMFRDHRTIGQWLPKTMYITRFSENGYKALASFDDIFWIAGGKAKTGGIASLEEFFPKIRKAFLIGEEFIGVIYRDEDDGEVSYDFNMAILAYDLPAANDDKKD